MLSRATAGACIILLLGGCAGPVENRGRAPDWSLHPVAPAPPRPSAARVEEAVQPAVVDRCREYTKALTPGETWIPLERWCRSVGLIFNPDPGANPAPAFNVSAGTAVVALRPNSQLVRWQGVTVYLGLAPVLINEEPFVHQLDLRKTVIPLLSGQPKRASGASRVVAIDPGHGGVDSGTRSVLTGAYEKGFTLDWALRLKTLLARYGYEPVLTHSTDQDLSISNRVAAAEQSQAAVFVSLHFNASGGGEEQAGLETYCLTPAGMNSSMTRGYDDDLTAVFPNNAFDAENLWLACAVHARLLRVNGMRDRGVRRARFLSVLRGQNRPAVLVEGGYLSNPAEARLIQTPEYRQQLAEAVALALRDFLAGPDAAPLGSPSNPPR